MCSSASLIDPIVVMAHLGHDDMASVRLRWAIKDCLRRNDSQHSTVTRELGMAGSRLQLLEGFAFENADARIELPAGMQRLLAYLALHGTAHRCVVAGTLWPEVPEAQALASLRTGIWRMNRTVPGPACCATTSRTSSGSRPASTTSGTASCCPGGTTTGSSSSANVSTSCG